MSSKSDEVQRLFERWKQEHRNLDTMMLDLGEWFHREGHVAAPPFIQAAEKLSELRRKVESHFAREEEISRLLANSRGTPTPELQSVVRQVEREHQTINERISNLIIKLGTAETEFENWEGVTEEFGLLCDLLEQHDEQEAQHIAWLSR